MNARAWHGARWSLSPRDRRALAGGAASVMLLLAGTRGWPAYRDWAGRAHADAARLTAELAHARRLVRDAAIARAAARAGVQARAAAEGVVVRGRTPTAAAAELGSLLREAADDAGLDIGPVTVSVDAADGRRGPNTRDHRDTTATAAEHSPAYVRVRASAEAAGLLGAVTALLESLEAGPHALRVREFALDPAGPAVVPGVPPGAEPQAVRLRVRLVVEGVARRPNDPKEAR